MTEPAPTPEHARWICGKCARLDLTGHDDMPEHHWSCPKRRPATSCPDDGVEPEEPLASLLERWDADERPEGWNAGDEHHLAATIIERLRA